MAIDRRFFFQMEFGMLTAWQTASLILVFESIKILVPKDSKFKIIFT